MIYGLDIGGTKIEITCFDDRLRKLDSARVATPVEDFNGFIDTLVTLIEEADQRHGGRGLVGIGMPGLIDREGRTLSANVPCATGKNVAQVLQARLQRPIAIANDCRLFALSEAHGGAGDGYARVYGAVLGTGAAGGLVINGELYRSRQGIAGEYGHHPLPAALRQKYQLPLLNCGCGLVGCLEPYIAGPGLANLHRQYCGQTVTVPELVERWRSGDTHALATREIHLDLLGAAFANLMMAHDPDVIVLGGGLSRIEELYRDLPRAIESHLFAGFTAPPIVPPTFGDASGARGAALLARQFAESPH
ncbi:ROK family protein [Microbulbifer salipaludis]|uniref:N-acetylglucosamine kinase n=1 Tax=Microbulbifer salipaludis TaxID=187980 RepID=A0ABS3E5T3_9GAMM|nr:ROK family protein [Microbulbifer salipaludis]MBN8430670.1 ROK family protein [Microbulbifer salipaludis]